LGKFDTHIEIGERKPAGDVEYFSPRTVTLENPRMELETPYKVIDGKGINSETASLVVKDVESPIFECQRFVGRYASWSKLEYLLNEAGKDRTTGMNDFLGIRKNLWEPSRTVVSVVFSKNPFESKSFKHESGYRTIGRFEEVPYNGFLDHIHSSSSAMVLCPDVRFVDYKNKDFRQHLRFVDYNMKVLSDFNSKAIFAPIQIDLPTKKMHEVLDHYRREGYRNIWVNFGASQFGGTNFARVRSLLRQIRDVIGLDEVALYYSHIKKEVNPNIKEDNALASDVLSQFLGADFVGVNRNPDRFVDEKRMDASIEKRIMNGEFGSREEFDRQRRLHASRVFSPETYYYHKVPRYPGDLPIRKQVLVDNADVNRLFNSVLVHKEVENTKTVFEKQKRLRPYLRSKAALAADPKTLDAVTGGRSAKGLELFDVLG